MATLKTHLFLLHCLRLFYETISTGAHDPPAFREVDKGHYNVIPPPPKEVEGTAWTVPPSYYAPDYRIPEKMSMTAFTLDAKEVNRPYRISPHYKQIIKHTREYYEFHGLLGCYCCTVYRERIPLAGCAIITTRHLLTTATSTELVLGARKHFPTLEGVLGAWYDTTLDTFNSSVYMTPARIHYHPRYIRPHDVNISHPLPVVMDLAVWAATIRFHPQAAICQRASASDFIWPSTPARNQMVKIVGFQWIRSWNRNPTPFHKYFLRTRLAHFHPCPKQDWGWFHCIRGPWFRLGVESGAALHSNQNEYERFDGLIGLCAFSMKLRTKHIVHYFTVVDTHPVLEFLYAAYMGKLPYEFLDQRFDDTQNRAPIIKPMYNLHHRYIHGIEKLTYYELPFW